MVAKAAAWNSYERPCVVSENIGEHGELNHRRQLEKQPTICPGRHVYYYEFSRYGGCHYLLRF
jgi:hypothetical protein